MGRGHAMHRRHILALFAALSATALPLLGLAQGAFPERPIKLVVAFAAGGVNDIVARHWAERMRPLDRKSTRLNSSHVAISYAVFCLKKKKKMIYTILINKKKKKKIK